MLCSGFWTCDQQAAVVEGVGCCVAQGVGDGDLALAIGEGCVLGAAVAVGIGQAALGVVTEVVVVPSGLATESRAWAVAGLLPVS